MYTFNIEHEVNLSDRESLVAASESWGYEVTREITGQSSLLSLHSMVRGNLEEKSESTPGFTVA